MKSLLFVPILLLVTVMIFVTAAEEKPKSNSAHQENTKLSPCIWTRKLKLTEKKDGNEYRNTIVESFNALCKEALQAEKQNLESKAGKIDSSAVIASILFSTTETKQSQEQQFFVDEIFPEEFQPLSEKFVSELYKRQKVVQSTCSAASSLQLQLEISLPSSSSSSVQQDLVSLLHGKDLLKSPILYTVLPLQKEETSSLFNMKTVTTTSLPFHQYKAEIHSLVLHNFFLGLRDLAPLVALDTPNCVRQVMLKNGDKLGDARKEAAKECMELAFSSFGFMHC